MLNEKMTNKAMIVALLTGLTLAYFLSAASAQDQKSIPVVPMQTWQGQMKDAALMKGAPTNNFIANTKDWEKLWNARRGDEKTPAVDFKKESLCGA